MLACLSQPLSSPLHNLPSKSLLPGIITFKCIPTLPQIFSHLFHILFMSDYTKLFIQVFSKICWREEILKSNGLSKPSAGIGENLRVVDKT